MFEEYPNVDVDSLFEHVSEGDVVEFYHIPTGQFWGGILQHIGDMVFRIETLNAAENPTGAEPYKMKALGAFNKVDVCYMCRKENVA